MSEGDDGRRTRASASGGAAPSEIRTDVRLSEPPAAFEREIRRLRFEDPEAERAFRDDYTRRRIPQFRIIFWVGLAIQVPLSLRSIYLDDIGVADERFWLRLAVGVVPAVAGLLLIRSPRLVRWSELYMLFYVVLIGATLVVIFAPIPIGWTRLLSYLTAACIMPRLRVRHAAVVQGLLIGWFTVFSLAILDIPGSELGGSLPTLGAMVLFILVGLYLIEHSARRDFMLMRLLGQEREKSERLLLNILPAPVAERLKESPGTVADRFDEVTVLFADIVNSTPNISRLSPDETVELLSEVFTSFDRLAAEHGLEKIKTVGDAYMVVGGLPEPREDHAEAVVAMALDMQREIARYRWPGGDPLVLRIGVHTGPVVAGVIGTTKFSYDLWGDTPNVASRMESHGVPGAIQLSASTYERVRDRYRFTERRLDVKGKGKMPTYVLEPSDATSLGAASASLTDA